MSICFYKNNFFTEGSVNIPVESISVCYGAGFFETILYDGFRIQYLDKHLERLKKSLNHFEFQWYAYDFEAIIGKLLNKNNLNGVRTRINIYCILVDWDQLPDFYIKVGAYKGPQVQAYRLQTSLLRHVSFISQHKSISYWPYKYMKLKAIKGGYDDALLIDSHCNWIETTSACLIIEIDSKLYTSSSDYRLPSISLQVFQEYFPVFPVQITTALQQRAKHVFILNALIGIQPVRTVDTDIYEVRQDLCKTWNAILFGAANE